MEETARGFGTPFVLIYANATPGLLTSAAESLGKIAIGGEFGWGRAVQANGVSMARQGVLAAGIRHEQLRGRLPPPREQILVDTSDPSSSLLAPLDGLFEPTVPVGQKVERGQGIGWLHDFGRLDEQPLALVAPHDGYVLCQAWGARVFQGQVISQVGKAVPWTS
jgi:predicted deacylase